jgi:hypothetical protein
MKINKISSFILVGILCFLFCRCTSAANESSYVAGDSASSNANLYAGYLSEAEWGSHLVTICNCSDCHTPKKMTDRGPFEDTSLMLSGHPSEMPPPVLMPHQIAKGLAATSGLTAWQGPWGTTYAANLTPDSTGLGSWSEEQFITCLREGLFKGIQGSRSLMPPMPFANYSKMTDAELKAIFAFLKTIKPVHNIVPDYQPPTGTGK